jgi:hypothetical protein
MVLKYFTKLLSYDNLIEIFGFDNPYAQANYMSKFINDICIIKDDELYIKMDIDIYEIFKNADNQLLYIITKLYNDSIEKLSNVEMNSLKFQYKKNYDVFQSNEHVKKFLPQLKIFLINNEIVFNYTPQEIHFQNGYIDVNKNKFYQRNDKHYITSYIKRDYKPSTEEERNEYFDLVINKIITNKQDRDLILTLISIGLSWKATSLQQSLFFVGMGSSGKSSLMTDLKNVLDCYFVELKSDSFSNSKGIDKVLNTFSSKSNPYLYTWINEMDSKSADISVYKSFCDGVINTTKLYKEGSHNTKHYSLSLATSNELPNLRQDTGTKRRMLGYECKSLFVDKIEDVNESKNIYLKDKNLQDKMPKYYNAIIDIYSYYCYNWLRGKFSLDFDKSKNFRETKDLLTSSNDYFQDFIDKRLILTDNENDRIGKEKMRNLFIECYPDKKINILQIISSLKDKKIKYDKEKRSDNVKGCFICVKIKENDDDDDIDANIIKVDFSIKQPKTLKEKLDEIEFYKQHIKKLEQQFINDCDSQFHKEIKIKNKKVKEPVKQIKVEIKKEQPKETIEDNFYCDDEPDFVIDFS